MDCTEFSSNKSSRGNSTPSFSSSAAIIAMFPMESHCSMSPIDNVSVTISGGTLIVSAIMLLTFSNVVIVLQLVQLIDSPPSTIMEVPVIQDDAPDSKNTAAFAMSVGWPYLFRG